MATSAKKAIAAIKQSQGFVTTAAKKLGISRTQLYNIINKYPTVKEALIDAREEMKDFAEAQLFKNIKDGKETSLIFYLKTQAKERGYVERLESYNFDFGNLTDEQLQRIANGEHPSTVLSNSSHS